MPVRGKKNAIDKINELVDRSNKKTRAIIFQGLANIITNSAVDTGRYRNNWFFTTGSPTDKVTNYTGKVGQAAINRLNKAIPPRLSEGVYYFQNNVPYAEWLEYGSDKHRGQVRIELQRIRRALSGD